MNFAFIWGENKRCSFFILPLPNHEEGGWDTTYPNAHALTGKTKNETAGLSQDFKSLFKTIKVICINDFTGEPGIRANNNSPLHPMNLVILFMQIACI